MKFYSTINKNISHSFQHALLKGLAEDGGLFMPIQLPELTSDTLTKMELCSFQDISMILAKKWLPVSIPHQIVKNIIADAFNFELKLVEIEKDVYVLELFHGPTLAFKDFAARFMSRLMAYYVKNAKRNLTILVATSGDTGSAVANGFYGMPGIRVIVLYPSKKISFLQEKQITTIGENIQALEIDGTFDDCQQLVKQAFVDPQLREHLWLTSANSINIARLIPQSFYYFYAYSRLMAKKKPLVFSVPSGNFGNLTGGLIAKRMGLPVHKFIAANNINDVVCNYLQHGIFEPKPSLQTISNAMDVGNPSNFIRIMDLYNSNLSKIRKDINGVSFSDQRTKKAIQQVYKKHHYIFDPHSAVGYLGLKEYRNQHSTENIGIILATAHPAKFKDVVEEMVHCPIEIPQRLKNCLNKEKKSIFLTNDYEIFKQYMLALH